MVKQTITPLELAQKYLIKIGLDKFFVQRALLPSLFEENMLCERMSTHNLVPKNKLGNKFNQTHINISRKFCSACFSAEQEASYKSNPVSDNNQKSIQNLLIFEANISDTINRRSKKKSASLDTANTSRIYSLTSTRLLSALTAKLFNTQGSSIQIHMGIEDDDIFKDFRLGLLLDDYLIMLKYANKDCILTISIPSEFCARFNIISRSKNDRKMTTKLTEEFRQYEQQDSEYSTDVNSKGINPEITSLSPAPAPTGSRRSASNKTKYHGKPSRGLGALQQATYTCEFDSSHSSFISKRTGENYMEPHHLIPISKQELYSNDIDITSNLVCLCPTCHKQIHYGTKSDIRRMLELFYNARNSNLKACGIELDFDTLLAYYDIN